jgi:hypothetical protein
MVIWGWPAGRTDRRERGVRAMAGEPLPARSVERVPGDGPEPEMACVLDQQGELPAVDRLVPVLDAKRGRAHGGPGRSRTPPQQVRPDSGQGRVQDPGSRSCAAAHRCAFCSPCRLRPGLQRNGTNSGRRRASPEGAWRAEHRGAAIGHPKVLPGRWVACRLSGPCVRLAAGADDPAAARGRGGSR